MNDFIEITNRVITEKLKDKIKISMVEYSVVDGTFIINVKFYTDEFVPKAFRYTSYQVIYDIDELEWDFKCFIDKNFN